MSVRFVAIIDAQSVPVYFRSATNASKEVEINHQFIAEMSLDFVEQQAAQLQSNLRVPMMVMLHDGIAVYAMLSNTRTTYLLGIESTSESPDVERLMHSVVDAFVGYKCNPFGTKKGPIKSPQFDQRIENIIQG